MLKDESICRYSKKGAPVPIVENVFMFSGQGSQYFQMGRALFDENDTFRDWMVRMDDVVRKRIGSSVVAALYAPDHAKGQLFDRTLLAHPAIFMVEYALAQCLRRVGVVPDIALGASVGSFAAAAVAGFIDAYDALAAVLTQAIMLDSRCDPGGMIAILCHPDLFAEEFLSANSELAAVNFDTHFVVSARLERIEAVEAGLRKRDVVYQRLPVTVAFHSQWIDKAREPFEAFMKSIQYRAGISPLMCCEQGELLDELPDSYFWNVIRHPIRFREAIRHLEERGTHRYVDVGPSGTLATFLKHELPANSLSKVHAILSPYGRDLQNLAAATIDRFPQDVSRRLGSQ